MGMFEDIKAMQRIETETEKELKNRFSALDEKYKSALRMIESLCVQVETMKRQLTNAENSKREEVNRLERENAETRSAFATISQELKRTKRQKAAITGNRDFWKRECEAVGMLYKLEAEENEKLSKRNTAPELKPTLFGFHKTAEPMRIVAAIGK